ncbi:exosortase F system-associated protein [Flavobacteriaceae bacterium R38]|nr:exosortase F system-associated protein [Flavobacteriaceae bacterium R38]
MRKLTAYLITGFLGVLLISIRAFENELFYDPFIVFFQQEFEKIAIPEFDNYLLLLNHAFRYFLNAGISLAILFVFFRDWQIIKISAILYSILFVLLGIIYFYFINYNLEGNYFTTFYIRRFLIQPLFIFILIPAFYYHKKHINDVKNTINNKE